MNAWVSYKDADGKPRKYNVPCRRISHVLDRVAFLARKKPRRRTHYATEITIRIERAPAPTPRVEAACYAE